MSDTNSYAEFTLGLFAAQFNDCTVQYPALAKEFKRDLSRLRSAIEHHGIKFVLETMPGWRKHFDVCLSSGRLTPSHLHHFGSWYRGGSIPRFLRGLVLRVFDSNGDLKPEPDVTAIRLIRQLLGVARKLRMDSGAKACSDAVRDFIRTDLENRRSTLNWGCHEDFTDEISEAVSFTDIAEKSPSKQGLFPFLEVSSLTYGHALRIQQVADYISACLGHFDPLDWRFRHGPGAVSDRPFSAHKYAFENWPDRLNRAFPMEEFASANFSTWCDSILYKTPDSVVRKEFPAKLCAVPKSIKTPRLIASEPTSAQWCQQSIRDYLYTRVRRSIIGSFVDFHRQEFNGSLAREASHHGKHATIDLSSASDRISCWHVERLFRRSPSLLNSLRATRSLWVRQDICRISPQHHVLRKYSTMGNATTFPVQSLFFLCVILGTICYCRDLRVNTKSFKLIRDGQVRVFGDDLIVPIDCAVAIVDALHALGLKVNRDKTFLRGKFRESCGVDAYDGEDVSTVSVLSVPNQAKPGSIVSSVDVHNNLCIKGYLYTAAYIQRIVSKGKYRNIPPVAHGSGFFGWYPNYINDVPTPKSRYNRDLQVREYWCLRQSAKATNVPSKDGAALLQYFTEAPRKVTSAFSTLDYPIRRARPSLKPGWVVLG